MTARPTLAEMLDPLRTVDDRGIRFEDEFLSWRAHSERADAAARHLLSLIPAGRPPHVGVLLPTTPDLSVLLHVAAISDLVVVALNPLRTPADLATDATRADCSVVVSDAEHRHLLSALPPTVTVIDVGEIGATVESAPIHRPGPDDLFALVFTSGTSGAPKAVRCSQIKVAAAGLMLAERFELGPADTVYISMPLFHSNAILAGWAVGVASGGSIALARRFSASRFLPDVRKFGATYANYVGTPLSYVLATPELPDDAVNPLRHVYGNEGHPDDLIAFATRFGVTVTDGYGSTEGGIAIRRTHDTPKAALGPLSPGLAVVDPDTDIVCPAAQFDEEGRITNASAAVGELVNRSGAGGFTGYYGDTDAEAERMRGGWYRSGDLAYVDSAGFAYFAGRLGDWLRVGGENLGTRPIATALRSHPAIVDAAVYGIPGARIGDVVMAAVVSHRTLTCDDLTAAVCSSAVLTERQRPTYIRITRSLPRTATFKVLTRTLSAEGIDTDDPVYVLTAYGYRALDSGHRKARP